MKNIVQNIASLSKKYDVFTQCFRFQKAHPETEIDEHDKLTGNSCVPSRHYVSPCISATNVCSCVQVLSHWSNLRIRLLASVRHLVNLQCIRESGSVVLFANIVGQCFCHRLKIASLRIGKHRIFLGTYSPRSNFFQREFSRVLKWPTSLTDLNGLKHK